jgi:hypothetical protein
MKYDVSRPTGQSGSGVSAVEIDWRTHDVDRWSRARRAVYIKTLRLPGIKSATHNNHDIPNIDHLFHPQQPAIFETSTMQLTTVFFALSGLAFAAAVPQALVPRDQIKDTLYVTFWQNGCYDTGSPHRLAERADPSAVEHKVKVLGGVLLGRGMQ